MDPRAHGDWITRQRAFHARVRSQSRCIGGRTQAASRSPSQGRHSTRQQREPLRPVPRGRRCGGEGPEGWKPLSAMELSDALGPYLGVKDQTILLGAGSGDLLRASVQAFTGPEKAIVAF